MKYSDKLLKIPSHTRKKEYYLSLGYEEKDGYFYIRCDDLPRYSGIQETRKCDNCGEDFTRRHEHHETTFLRFGMDLCGKCVKTAPEIRKKIYEKVNNSFLERFGGHPAKTEQIQAKIKKTCLEKYGVETPSSSKEIKEKIKRTNLQKYGGFSPQCDPEIRKKTLDTLYKNDNVPTSSQQKKIFEIVSNEYGENNCFLNFQLSRVFLDVVVILDDNVKIDIEYDGKHWHQDKNKDRKRDEFVKTQGYKVLRISSSHKIPTVEQLNEKIKFLKESEHNFTELKLE